MKTFRTFFPLILSRNFFYSRQTCICNFAMNIIYFRSFINTLSYLFIRTRITNLEFLDDSTVRFIVLGKADSLLENESVSDRVTDSTKYDNKEISCREAMGRLLLSVNGGNFKVPLDGELHIAKSM